MRVAVEPTNEEWMAAHEALATLRAIEKMPAPTAFSQA
jgi:hypothetical protein